MIPRGPLKADGDSELAAMMRAAKIPAPVEKIQHVDWVATALNCDKLKDMEVIVRLECGHTTITRNLVRCRCHDCHQMILNGEDYDGFRNPSYP